MNIEDYKKEALRTDYTDYSDFHTGDSSPRLDYATIGLVTSSAKILNIVKKTKKKLNPLDKNAALEELGDLLWYFNLTLDELGFTFDEVIKNNLDKIKKKYPTGDADVSKMIRG